MKKKMNLRWKKMQRVKLTIALRRWKKYIATKIFKKFINKRKNKVLKLKLKLILPRGRRLKKIEREENKKKIELRRKLRKILYKRIKHRQIKEEYEMKDEIKKKSIKKKETMLVKKNGIVLGRPVMKGIKRYYSTNEHYEEEEIKKFLIDTLPTLSSVVNFLTTIPLSDIHISKDKNKGFVTGGRKGEFLLKELGFIYKSEQGKEYMLNVLKLFEFREHETKRRLSVKITFTLLQAFGLEEIKKWISYVSYDYENSRNINAEIAFFWRDLLAFGEGIKEFENLVDTEGDWEKVYEELEKYDSHFWNKIDEE